MTVEEKLEKIKEIYYDRQQKYGHDTFKDVAAVLKVLHPDGVTLVSSWDFETFALLVQIVGKLCRYVEDPRDRDHMDDLSLYAAILGTVND